MTDVHEILDFWFGPGRDDAATAGRQAALWWRKNPETDARIRERFESTVAAAAAGDLEHWRERPDGRLALILLLDQFPRNMYRDTPDMYRHDERARTLCVEGVEQQADAGLRLIERVFFYLPLEHSENADHQAWCVDLMRGLVREAPAKWTATFEEFVEFAVAHRRIIDRFGRFPHRNAILGRDATGAEVEFLKQPRSSF